MIELTPALEIYRDGREVCRENKAGSYEYALRTMLMAHRQGWKCAICGRKFENPEDATFDHERGRGYAGGFREDRIEVAGQWVNAAVHYRCNAQKASRRYSWQNRRYVEDVSRRKSA